MQTFCSLHCYFIGYSICINDIGRYCTAASRSNGGKAERTLVRCDERHEFILGVRRRSVGSRCRLVRREDIARLEFPAGDIGGREDFFYAGKWTRAAQADTQKSGILDDDWDEDDGSAIIFLGLNCCSYFFVRTTKDRRSGAQIEPTSRLFVDQNAVAGLDAAFRCTAHFRSLAANLVHLFESRKIVDLNVLGLAGLFDVDF